MNKIVLARYRESVDWIVHIPDDFEIYIYNKGNPIVSPAVLRRAHSIIERPNVGRESETYLFHMGTKVDDSNNFTVYAQADPFTHSPDFMKLLPNWRQWSDLQPLSWGWREDHDVPPRYLRDDYEAKLDGRLRVRPERFSLHTWMPIEFFDVGAYNTSRHYREVHGQLPEGTNVASHFLNLAKLPHLAREAELYSLGVFSYGALFAARNFLVKKLPTESLKMLYQASLGDICYGYILERLWLHILDADFELPKIEPAPHNKMDYAVGEAKMLSTGNDW